MKFGNIASLTTSLSFFLLFSLNRTYFVKVLLGMADYREGKKKNTFNDSRRREHVPVKSMKGCQTLTTSSLELARIFQAETNLIRKCQFLEQGIFSIFFYTNSMDPSLNSVLVALLAT